MNERYGKGVKDTSSNRSKRIVTYHVNCVIHHLELLRKTFRSLEKSQQRMIEVILCLTDVRALLAGLAVFVFGVVAGKLIDSLIAIAVLIWEIIRYRLEGGR